MFQRNNIFCLLIWLILFCIRFKSTIVLKKGCFIDNNSKIQVLIFCSNYEKYLDKKKTARSFLTQLFWCDYLYFMIDFLRDSQIFWTGLNSVNNEKTTAAQKK